MKNTPLYQTHIALRATMAPFAGWNMPVSYPSGTLAEVSAVRSGVGIFDVSHMGEVRVTGSRALNYVQMVASNDASLLKPGRAQYSLLLNELGGIVDDIIVYREDLESFLIVLNAGCMDKDWDWLMQKAEGFPGIQLNDISSETALIAVQGPGAIRLTELVLSGGVLIDADDLTKSVTNLPRFGFAKVNLQQSSLMVSRTGYTGNDGVEIFCSPDLATGLWQQFVDAGAIPSGLGARDVLRLEAAYPLYGHELDEVHGPWSSGVGWAVKLSKSSFIGQEQLIAKRNPDSEKLVGLQMCERSIPRQDFTVFASSDEQIGTVTSGTFSPSRKAGIAMARISVSHSLIGTEVAVNIRGRMVPAKVVRLPFYRDGV